jgi:cyclohexadienyl dehydratase
MSGMVTVSTSRAARALLWALVRCGWLAAFVACAAPAAVPPSPAGTDGEAASRAAPAPPGAAPLAELRVGTSGDYAPFSSQAAGGERTGFDIELAEQLAADLGLSLRWVPFRWPELAEQLAAGDFDVAMGGVSWQPARAVTGYMTRALARGGPCVLGDAAATRVAVNRGGVLEAWARSHLADRELTLVDDNRSLPELLAQGRVGALVTDSFELRAFARPGWASQCEAPLTRKVYWVGPARARELGPRIDGWQRQHTADILEAQQRWFGARQRLDATTHLMDLLARRFAFMPIVAALKAARGLPLEDLAREREVLTEVQQRAARLGLPAQAVSELFALQIELSKAVQRRQSEPSTLDLQSQVRPALLDLGERIVAALAELRDDEARPVLAPGDLAPLSPWLTPEERQRVLTHVQAILADAHTGPAPSNLPPAP